MRLLFGRQKGLSRMLRYGLKQRLTGMNENRWRHVLEVAKRQLMHERLGVNVRKKAAELGYYS